MATAVLTTTRPPSMISPEALQNTASWIRDTLDPLIAREGPDIMWPDDCLALQELFQNLQFFPLSKNVIAVTRIHNAVREIAGKATRWPHRLADACDNVIELWERIHGSLEAIRPPLYERGGRLWKISAISDLTRDDMFARWSKQSPNLVDDERAYSHYLDEFEPGHWWINAMLAFRDGIIDCKSTDGGICVDKHGAYAILMKDDDEIASSNPHRFTYRCRPTDKGRYKLTAANFNSRHPIRILRSHSLSSLWAPRAGVRYDGLYRVKGWRQYIPDKEKTKENPQLTWEVEFEREEGQVPMKDVLLSPQAADVDDYREYKRLRRLQREYLRHQAIARLTGEPAPTFVELEKTPSNSKPLPSRAQTMYKDGRIVFPQAITAQSGTTMSMDSAQTLKRSESKRRTPSQSSQVMAPFARHQPIPKPSIPAMLAAVSPTASRPATMSSAHSGTDSSSRPNPFGSAMSPSRQTTGSTTLSSSAPITSQASSSTAKSHSTTSTKRTIAASPMRHVIIASPSSPEAEPETPRKAKQSGRDGTTSLLTTPKSPREGRKPSFLLPFSKSRGHSPPDDVSQASHSSHKLRAMPGSFYTRGESPPSASKTASPHLGDKGSNEERRSSILGHFSRLFDGVEDSSLVYRARKPSPNTSTPLRLNIEHITHNETKRNRQQLHLDEIPVFREVDWSAPTSLERFQNVDTIMMSPCSRPLALRRTITPLSLGRTATESASIGNRSVRSVQSAQQSAPSLQRQPPAAPPADRRAIARARFQRLLQTRPSPFETHEAANRFLKALIRVWPMLSEAEYPDMLVAEPRSKSVSTLDFDGAAATSPTGSAEIAEVEVDGTKDSDYDTEDSEEYDIMSGPAPDPDDYFGSAARSDDGKVIPDMVYDALKIAYKLREHRNERFEKRTIPALGWRGLDEYHAKMRAEDVARVLQARMNRSGGTDELDDLDPFTT
ncbi:hypothetical protein NA57DRAFT_70799 [Rhizodiscina lignyota]|uniref:YDG domain-containing protein n=1 Tax=Rhizodiscina lignyota TaxID=1504668 RepID=A0A9P4MB00_9PEZI|nr:hypothetical protein NA57DRAFT_70799 [Rhizodiscina lignyota]